MSVQLILYPQSYGGQFNSISSSPSEAVVNGIKFVNLNNSTTYTSTASNPYLDTVTNEPADIVNTWYRFRKGSLAYPTASLGDVTLVGGSSEISGVYQTISSLTIGALYTVTINIPTAVVGGNVKVGVYLGTSLLTSTTYNSNVTQISKTFIGAANELTVMISYSNATSTDLTISNISAQPIIGAIPSGDTSILDNGQVICDLYEDEDLPLTLSVDNFKNVAEKVQSYSKAFNLPATKRNNKIFDQVFEITRSDDGVIFNVYKKTKCVLKQDGFILFEGYLRLLDVTDKNGEISYSVNLYSEVIALADFLKDSDFRALDFTELTHEYNKDNIKNSWNDSGTGITYTEPSTSGFRDAYSTVKYPFVNWNNSFIVAAAGGTPTAGNPQLPNLESAFRPWINAKYIIDRIFEGTPFTYESDFFDTADFEKLYMDFNWGADNNPVQSVDDGSNTFFGTNGQGTHFAGTSYTNFVLDNTGLVYFVFPPNYDSTTNIITSTATNETYNINYDYTITNTDSVARTIECRYLKNSTEFNYSGVITLAAGASFVYQGNLNMSLDTGDTLQAQFKASSAGVVQQDIYGSGGFGTNVIFILGVTNITTDTILQTLRGETGQWDFLKGLITMFNLVTVPDKDNPNNIIIEPYSDIFITSTDSTELNWTDKVDVSEMKLTPLADLNKKTIFKFVEDDDDFPFTNYKNQVGGHLYGSKKYNAGNEFNILEGTNEVIAEPFAATVVKPLMYPQYPQFVIPSIYAYNSENQESEGFENSPRIMYNNGIQSTGVSYYIPPQNGVAEEQEFNYLNFSHIKDGGSVVADYTDFHFGECQLVTGAGTGTLNNLFNLYWLPYYSELYNPNTRIMTIKVNLTPADINTFKFNDTVMIKNRIFRVNKIDYKPNDLATVEFILIP